MTVVISVLAIAMIAVSCLVACIFPFCYRSRIETTARQINNINPDKKVAQCVHKIPYIITNPDNTSSLYITSEIEKKSEFTTACQV